MPCRHPQCVGAADDHEPILKNQHVSIPLTSTLLAFEAVARNESVSRAATELNTSQSAISRHLKSLEDALGVKLLQRTGRGMSLTDSGRAYFHAVQRSINDLEATAHELRTQRTRLTIACTSEISTLVLLPVVFRLKRLLGEEITVEVAVHDGRSRDRFGPRVPDIVFDRAPSATAPGPDAVKMLDEEIVPVASPEFVERFASVLGRDPSHWSTVPRLEVSERNRGWADWNIWFQAHGCTAPEAPVDIFEDYAHLLRAAAEGGGLAVGRNGLFTDYFADGRLVAVRDTWLRTGLSLYATPTQYGKRNRASQRCLKELAKLVAELCQWAPSMRARKFARSEPFTPTRA